MNRLKSFDKVFKKVILVGIVVFLIFILALFIGGNLTKSSNNKANIAEKTPQSSIATPNQEQTKTLSVEEVSKHSTASDCWLIIAAKVYNVTSFLSQHPGGASRIIPYCGKEATTAFQTRGGRGESHSSFASNLLDSYLVGSLGQSVKMNEVLKAPSNPVNLPSNINKNSFENEDD